MLTTRLLIEHSELDCYKTTDNKYLLTTLICQAPECLRNWLLDIYKLAIEIAAQRYWTSNVEHELHPDKG